MCRKFHQIVDQDSVVQSNYLGELVSDFAAVLAAANSNRMSLMVSSAAGAQIEDGQTIVVGPVNSDGYVQPVASISLGQPSVILRREDVGEVLTREIWAQSPQGTYAVSAWELIVVR